MLEKMMMEMSLKAKSLSLVPKFARETTEDTSKYLVPGFVETKEYKAVDQALENASEEEKKIYEDANLEKGEVNGREALQRTDIDYSEKDDFGRTNLERMKVGQPPIKDGVPIELHHIGQDMDSPLAELTRDEHRGKGNDTILHDKQKESEIDRNQFKKEREEYWKARAEQIQGQG